MNEKPREEMEIRDSLHLNDGFNYVHNLSAFCKSDFKCQCKNIHSFYARHLQCHTHSFCDPTPHAKCKFWIFDFGNV